MLHNKIYVRNTGYPHFQDVAICWPALASAGQGKILAQVTAPLPMASDVRLLLGPIYLPAPSSITSSSHRCIREHYATLQLQRCRPSPIAKTAVADGLEQSVARQPVHSASVTLLVYIIIVSGKIARQAFPLFVPLHSTCGICRLPWPITSPPTAIPAYPRCSRSRRRVRLLTQRLKSRHRTGSSHSNVPQHSKLMA
jgi:hypothetical protein